MKGIFNNPSMGILQKSLDASSLRHKTIANNISNINTPNYKRQLVTFEEELDKFLQKSGGVSLATTNSKHISNAKKSYLDISPQIERDESIMRTDGNNVDIDLEFASLAENTVKFNVLSQSIGKKFSMLKAVIQGGR